MKSYLRILQYLRPFWPNVTLSVVSNAFTAIFSLFSFLMIVPFLQILFGQTELVNEHPGFSFSVDGLTKLFNYQMSEFMREDGKSAALIFICILVAITSFLKNFFRYFSVWIMAPARNGVSRDLRNDLFHKVLHLPLSFFSEEKKGDLITRSSSDVQEVENSILNTLEVIFKEPITIIFYMGTLFFISPLFTLYVLILLLVTALIIGRIGRKLKLAAREGQGKLSILLSMLEETLTGMRIVKAFNAEKKVGGRFKKENQLYYRIMRGLVRKRDLSSPLTEFLATIVVVIVLYIGGNNVLEGSLGASMFIGYLVIFSQLINPAKHFSKAYYQIQKGIASSQRVEEIMDVNIVLREKENAAPLKDLRGKIAYNNVQFAYSNEPVLQNINLEVNKGKMIALVGPSGAGKSTLADLLPRFYDVTGGSITIDGADIRDVKIRDLRGMMGIVSQEPILFNDTIFNNIAFGKEGVQEDQVVEAAKIANAHGFIERMPQGYRSFVGERGQRLSGGERQRITIARAVLKNPSILILDEATSSLDSESEKLVQEALFKLMENRTSIVIAHRLSTIQHADEIIVMRDGQIIERGNHIGLLSKNGMYKKLVEMQAF